MRKSVLVIAAVQTCIPSRPGNANLQNLEAMLTLLDQVQRHGGRKDICLFPAVALPGDALPHLAQAARRYSCMLIFGTEVSPAVGGILVTTIAPTGEIRVEHAAGHGASVFTLRTRHGAYRVVDCAAEGQYPESAGLMTAIHSPDGRAIVASRSRAEQAVAAVLDVGSDQPQGR